MTSDPTSSSPAVLELQDVDVPSPSDPDELLVRSLNWRVSKGERWLVSGPPGSGKSSTVQVAAGLIRPSRGKLLLFGEDLAETDEDKQVELRARVGLVFSGGGRLFAHISVAENLALPLIYHAKSMPEAHLERVAEVLEELQLAAYARRMPRELPRWIASRIGLARALMLRPEVLLLDEPGSGRTREDLEWWRKFVAGCTTGECLSGNPPHTILMAVQDTSPWRDLADRAAHLNDGVWQVEPATARPGPELLPGTAR